MPAEVISLLSSPEPKASTPPPPARTRKQPPPPAKRPTPPSRVLDYDPFDTIDDDAARRSTHKPSFAAFRDIPNLPSGRRIQSSAASDDVWFLDDDIFHQPSPKRQRLPSVNDNVAGRRTNLTRAEPPAALPALPQSVQKGGPTHLNLSLEQVEVSSSPRFSAGNFKNKTKTPDLSDDPFATSPPPREKPEPAALVHDLVDIDADSDVSNLFVTKSPRRDPISRRSSKRAIEWDPLSSSAPLPAATAKEGPPKTLRALQKSFSEVIILDESDDKDDDDCMAQPGLSDDEFPDIDKIDPSKFRAPAPKRQGAARSPPTASNLTKNAGTRAPAVKKSAEEKAREQEEKAAERERKKEEKEREKERERKEKALAKERAAALADVNKVRTDKKVSTPEMIVDLPNTLSHTTKLQAETLLKDLDVQAEDWSCPVDNVVRWRRKVRCRYNDEAGHWEPIPMRIEVDNYAMAILSAAEFVQRAVDRHGMDLEEHVTRMQTHFPNHTIIYLIEGLTPWMRKNRNLRNRQFASEVRRRLEEDAPGGSQLPSSNQDQERRRTNKSAAPEVYIDEDGVEDALLQLQVLHGALIHHTAATVETAQWIAVFTQHISTVPYRRQREESNTAAAAFCMEAGQVRTGDGPKDTYVRMLQEIGRVTAPIAYGIAGEFDSVSKLVRGLETEGPLRLQAIRKSANKDGAISDRAVGLAVSKRIHKIFTGRDETSTEV
ncbi:ERCC4 domain-containing protein [Apodospora peruviana]|uniref:ERCC4 domain-containing protein n=1 Tax=Apodospora peruviana TaxID=516989 RepID=A0AAE0M0W3_9PEZI|nr:ERCC4 domain-containing protein [Apodospora peruviana]